MKLEDLNYKISEDLIATEPKFPRDDSSLLIFNKEIKICHTELIPSLGSKFERPKLIL